MASLLDKFQKEMRASGVNPRTASARSWLQSKISTLKIPTNRSSILGDNRRISAQAFIGKMYFFKYDPKFKETLPVWDKFPLVIPMDIYSDGFLALNLHYLDPYTRLMLLDRLHDFINNDKYDDTTVFRLSYQLLAKSRRYSMIEPCVKRYLSNHIMSPLIYIEPNSWETALFLPTEKMVYRT
jgi:hypothetical protein